MFKASKIFSVSALLCSVFCANTSLHALETYSETLSGNYLAARAAQNSRDNENAVFFYREVLKDDPFNAQMNEKALYSLVADGRIKESIAIAKRLLNADANHRLSLLVLGVDALRQGQRDQARSFFNKLARGPLSDVTADVLKAWVIAAQGETKEAIASLNKLAEQPSFKSLADYHAGLIADRAGWKKSALSRLQTAHAKDPDALRIVDAYARALARSEQKEQAKVILQDYLKRVPNNPIITQSLKDIEQGSKTASQTPSALMGAAEALFGLGSVLGRQGGEDLSVIYLQLAMHLNPEHDIARFTLGNVYEQIKRYNEAIVMFKAIDTTGPLATTARIEIATMLDHLKRTPEALSELKSLLAQRENDIELQTVIGNLHRNNKAFKEAIPHYTKAIEQSQKSAIVDWRLYYLRGICYERSKEWPLAETDLKKALELSPDQPSVLNYLGYSWVDRHEKLDEAIKLIQRAVDIRPQDGYIVDSLGWAYYKLGDYEKAAIELEKAVELRPGDAVINDHLGDAYWKIGRQLEAKFQWQRALDNAPEDEEKPKIQEKLVRGLVNKNVIDNTATIQKR